MLCVRQKVTYQLVHWITIWNSKSNATNTQTKQMNIYDNSTALGQQLATYVN